jgi:ribosomal-protein-alanine N-acetyltransferase
VSFGQTQDHQLKVQIRWLIRRDMPAVLGIEQRSFEFAWTEEHFLEYLRQRNCIGMVAECNQQILGFMIYELHKSKLRILNFAVDPEMRRRGVGTQMVQRLVDKLAQQRREEIELEVRETNLAAQLFFRQHHFRATEVLREHYEDTDEDAYRMLYRLDEPLDWVLPFPPSGRISFRDAA